MIFFSENMEIYLINSFLKSIFREKKQKEDGNHVQQLLQNIIYTCPS